MSCTGEVVAIGDELLHGAGLDTNSAWIARELERLGVTMLRFTVVGDDPAQLAEAIETACRRADVVVSTGGLGPTVDDRTREVVASVLGVGQVFDEPSWRHIREWLESRGRTVPESNRRQAMLPEGAAVLANEVGTAPGFAVGLGRARFFAVPGVPREMRAMLKQFVLPAVAGLEGLRPTFELCLRVLGPSEALLGERIGDFMAAGRNPAVGITASSGMMTVRVVAVADDRDAAAALCEQTASELRPLLGSWLFSEGSQELPELVIARFAARGETMATAESCTGGQLAARLVDVPGASEAFLGGIVAYHNESKSDLLGVPESLLVEHGAVSEPVAAAMAEGVRQRFGATVAISTTGIAGPGGEVPGKPVGTVCFAVSRTSGTRAWTQRFPAIGRDFVRDRAVFECFRELLA